jgi:hypothetical protein
MRRGVTGLPPNDIRTVHNDGDQPHPRMVGEGISRPGNSKRPQIRALL